MAYRASSPWKLWRFYAPLLKVHWREAVRRLASLASGTVFWIGVVIALVLGLNNQIGTWLRVTWLHFSPWFAAIPLGIVGVYLLLDLSYQEYERVEADNRLLSHDLDEVMGGSGSPTSRRAVIERLSGFSTRADERAVLVRWVERAVTQEPVALRIAPGRTDPPFYVTDGQSQIEVWSKPIAEDLISRFDTVVHRLRSPRL